MTDEKKYADETLNELIARALSPISDEFPCGESEDVASSIISQIETNSDSIYSAIHEAAGDAMRSEDGATAIDLASVGRDMNEMVELTIDCLESKSKSLILATYLPHMLMIVNGLPGFSAGLDIVRQLVEQYPDQVFPRDKERILNYLKRGVYIGNDDKVTDNYRLFLYTPITDSQSKQLPYALYRNSVLKSANPDIDAKYVFEASHTNFGFYVTLIGDLTQIIETAKATNTALTGYVGDAMAEVIGYSFIESLERMIAIVSRLATDHCDGYPPVEELPEAEAAVIAVGQAGVPAPAALGEIVSREQAVELLSRIATFFQKTERHSPVAYSLRQAVKWTKMDLPELLAELLNGEEQPLKELAKRVGFRATEEGDGES